MIITAVQVRCNGVMSVYNTIQYIKDNNYIPNPGPNLNSLWMPVASKTWAKITKIKPKKYGISSLRSQEDPPFLILFFTFSMPELFVGFLLVFKYILFTADNCHPNHGLPHQHHCCRPLAKFSFNPCKSGNL